METTDITPTHTATTNGWWDALPSSDEPGDGPEPVSPKPKRTESMRVSRRRFMQGALALGGALSLNGLQMLSGVKLRPAGAQVGSEYYTCANYDNWRGYNDNTLLCVGGSYSSYYCGGDGWFKYGYTDNSTRYFRPVAACGAGGLAKRNAWRWTKGTNKYRCADGQYYYKYNGSWYGPYFRICSKWLGST